MVEKKTRLVEVEYWSCGHPEHFHKTEKGATGCVSRGANGIKEPQTRWSNNSLRLMYVSVVSGRSYKDTGLAFGVSQETIRAKFNQMVRRINRWLWKKNQTGRQMPIDVVEIRKNPELAKALLYEWQDSEAKK